MNRNKTLRINLHLPRHWNALTAEQMETVADCITRAVAESGTAGGYNPQKVKTDIFLRLTGLEITDAGRGESEPDRKYFMAVKRYECGGFWKRLYMKAGGRHKSPPFKVYMWQLGQWIDEGLKWIDNPSNRTIFPYPVYKSKGRVFRGPSTLMQNFNWRQYRIVVDYMDYYVQESNSMVKYASRKDCDLEKLAEMQKTVRNARNLLLASLFCEEIKLQSITGRMEKDSPYVPGQEARNKDYFDRFTDIQMQVVLFWWNGIMGYLQKKYPKVFKKGSTRKQQQVNPFEVYIRIMANLEKYLNGVNEEQINNETYTAVLTHLNDMMTEQERLERKK